MNQTVELPSLRVGAKSHPGKVRSENQDRMGRFPSPFGELYIVVDGMGGHKGGATAAAMTVDGLESHLKAVQPQASPEQALQEAAQKTNSAIYQKANDGDPETANMGATLVLALVRDGRLIVAHAGDSRVYLFRGGKLSRLTRDHSVVQRMIDSEMITEEQARDHPDASVITRAFGQKPELELEVSEPLALKEGDGILLCSDGLCGYVDDDVIERVISQHTDAQKVTDALIEMALSAGGEDNVTVQFLQFGERKRRVVVAPLTNGNTARNKNSRSESSQALRIGLILSAIVLACIIVLFVAGVIPGWDRLFSSSNRNNNAQAVNENNNTAPEANRNEAAEPRTEGGIVPGVRPDAGGGVAGGSSDGNAASSPNPAGSPNPTGQAAESPPSYNIQKPVGIILSGGTYIAEDRKNVTELVSEAGLRTLVLLSAEPATLASKCVYYRDDSLEARARRVAGDLRYSLVKPFREMPGNLASDFAEYDIIICP